MTPLEQLDTVLTRMKTEALHRWWWSLAEPADRLARDPEVRATLRDRLPGLDRDGRRFWARHLRCPATLRVLLTDRSADVRAQACRTLADLNAIDVLVVRTAQDLLEGATPVTFEAALATLEIAGDPDLVAHLAQLDVSTRDIRARVVVAMGRQGPAGVAMLADWALHGAVEIRAEALYSLRRVDLAADLRRDIVLSGLDAVEGTVRTAATCLAMSAAVPEAEDRLLRATIGDRGDGERSAAFHALAILGSPRGRRSFIEAIPHATTTLLRVVRVWPPPTDDLAVALDTRLAQEQDPRLGWAIAQSLSHVGTTSSIPALQGFLVDLAPRLTKRMRREAMGRVPVWIHRLRRGACGT